jgi:hypothetical protein
MTVYWWGHENWLSVPQLATVPMRVIGKLLELLEGHQAGCSGRHRELLA